MNIKNTLRPISAIELCDDCERVISCGFCLYCDEPVLENCATCDTPLTLDWNPYGWALDAYTCPNCFEPNDEQIERG